MNKPKELIKLNDKPLTNTEFLEVYNKNMPKGYPHASLPLLKKFKDEHSNLFKGTSLWSINQHRKRLIDWLPQNI